MDEFKHNESNLTNLNESINMKQQDSRVPEYSFWAEQMSSMGSNQKTVETYYGAEDAVTMQSHNIVQNNEGNTPKKKHRVSRFIFKAACFGILAGAGFIGALTLYNRLNPEQVKESSYILGAVDTDTDIQALELKVLGTEKGTVKTTSQDAVSSMVDQTMPSIVSITSVSTQTDAWFGGDYDREGSGSGIIVGKTDKELLLATNNHVVEGANQITVTFIDGEKVEAVIKGTDSAADLAVISIDIKDMKEVTLKDIKIAKLGNSDEIKVGEMTVAIGNALGYGQSVTVGYVSAKDRKLEVSDNYSYKTMVLLQTDAAINPGNSGGALLNIEGEVIGINTVKYSSSEVEGMGYAIPISRATPIINDLMSREVLSEDERGLLGVYTTDVTESISQMYNLPIGVFITKVETDSAADKAGLLQGDIITAVNDKEITSNTQLKEMISSIKAGIEVKVTFMRASEGTYVEQTLNIELGSSK